MYIYKRKSPILVYKGKINFEGYFVLTPEVFMGNGTTKYQELILKSKETYFLATQVTAKQGDIDITSNQSKRNALGATNVNANLDLTQDYAKFKTNSDTSKVSLPSNLFSTTLNQFQFDMKSKEVKFQKLETQKTDQAYFKSDNPVQEELQFTSSNATYNLNNLNLKAENVPFLLIGDAEVTTPNKELTIKKDGEIGAIKDAIIVCSDKNKFHTINHCLVTIFSKNRLTGYGDYTYTDKNKNNYNIFFNDIHTNEFKETVAKGNIADTSKFYLAPAIDYQGSVTLYSTVKNLYFNGYLKPEHPFNARLGTQWVKMQDTVDPQNVLFDLQHPIGMDKKDLFCGNFFSLDSSKAYDLFYGKKKNPKDIAILNVDGYMVYDEKNEAFVVKERNKLFPNKDDDTAYIGSNSAIVDKNRGTFYTEGNYNFNTNYKVFNYQTAGSYTYNFNDKKGVFDLAMIADIPLNDDLYKLMLDSILLGSSAEKEAKLSGNGLLNAFCLMIKDRKDKQKVVNEFSGYGYLTSAELINKALVFSSIKMSFNDSLRAYMSDGPIALAASKKVGINKYISGVIKIKPNKKQNRVGLLVESSPNGGFHFMEFVGGQAQFLSSDQSFNDLIGTAGPKVSKAGYKVTLATIDDAVRLKNKMPENEDILLKEEQEKKALQEAEEIKLDGSGPTKPKEKVGADAIKIDETEELSDEEKVKLEAKKAAEAEKKAKADEKEAKKKAKKEKKAAEEEAKKKAAEGEGGNANPSDSTQSKPAEIKKEDDSKPKEDGK